MKFYLFSLYICLIILGINSQNSHVVSYTKVRCCDTLFWTENIQLHWEDFKGVPNSDFYNAEAHTNFLSKVVYYDGNNMTIEVYTYFLTQLSWVKNKDNYGLNHELYHFHITEIGARKLRKDIKQNYWYADNFEEQFKLIANINYNYTIDMQQRYDEETVHSLDTISQMLWEEKIKDSLSFYSDYSLNLVKIDIQNNR